jgi:CheY-like chemotaxis protein
MKDAMTVQILLVDDDEVDVMAIQRAFRRAKIGNPIHVARDGIEALAILRGLHGGQPLARPFLILLDLNMPRMNGIEFLEQLRADPDLDDSVVFVLTTSDDEEDKSRAYHRHIAGYVVKSDPANGFMQAIDMLQAYWRVVELPMVAA